MRSLHVVTSHETPDMDAWSLMRRESEQLKRDITDGVCPASPVAMLRLTTEDAYRRRRRRFRVVREEV